MISQAGKTLTLIFLAGITNTRINFRMGPLIHEYTRGRKVQDKLGEERRFFFKRGWQRKKRKRRNRTKGKRESSY